MPIEVLKFIHVLAAIVWLGGHLIETAITEGARSQPAEARTFWARAVNKISPMYGASAMLIAATGIWMVVDGRTPWEFSQLWVSIGLGAFILGAGLGLGYFVPQGKKIEAELVAGGGATADARERRYAAFHRISTLGLLVAVWAMVFKPGL